MAQHQIILEWIATQVEVAPLHAQIVTTVAHVFNSERRGFTSVEDFQCSNLQLNIAGRHIGVFRKTFDDSAGCFHNKLTSQ